MNTAKTERSPIIMHGNAKPPMLTLHDRVALARQKIEKETLAQTHSHILSEVKLNLSIVFQAMEDLYLKGISAIEKAMAVVYLYSSEIKELEEMNIETGWVQRILKEKNILNVNDISPYIDACLIIQLESSRPYSKRIGNSLNVFIPVCEDVEEQYLNHMVDAHHFKTPFN